MPSVPVCRVIGSAATHDRPTLDWQRRKAKGYCMTRHHHRVLVCAALITGAITPALAQQPGLNTIYTFPTGNPATTGYWPRGGLAMDTTGALYGTTFYGGNCPINFPYCGTIYKLTPPAAGQTAWSYTFLHGFSQQVPIQGYNEDGISPISPLTNYQGVMYGTASAGGDTNCGCGNVFSMCRARWILISGRTARPRLADC
jgi:hypothetical protein